MAIPKGTTKEEGVEVVQPKTGLPRAWTEPWAEQEEAAAREEGPAWWETADAYENVGINTEPQTPTYRPPVEEVKTDVEPALQWKSPTPLSHNMNMAFPIEPEITETIFDGVGRWFGSRVQALKEIVDTKIEQGQSPIGAYVSTIIPSAVRGVAGVFGEIFWGVAQKIKRAAGYLYYTQQADPWLYEGAAGDPNANWNLLIAREWAKAGDERLDDYPELKASIEEYNRNLEAKKTEHVKAGKTQWQADLEARLDIMKEQWPKTAIAQSASLIRMGLESFQTGEPIDFDEMQAEAWRMSEGYGYTHMLFPQHRHEYEKLVADGAPPLEAGYQTQSQLVEIVGEIILDPMAWVGIQAGAGKVISKGIGAITRTIGAATGLVSRLVPRLSTVINELIDVTVSTKANRWGMGLRDTLQWFSKYTDDVEEALAMILDPKLGGHAADLSPHYQRMVRFAGEALKEGDDKIAKALIKKAKRLGLSLSSDLLIDTAAAMAYKVAKDKFMDLAPQWYKTFEKFSNTNRILRATQTCNAFLVETWLGTRPSWNLFNYIDNAIKAALIGVNPFHALDRKIARFANYGKATGAELIADAKAGVQVGMNAGDAFNLYKTHGHSAIDSYSDLLPSPVIGREARVKGKMRPGLAEGASDVMGRWVEEPGKIPILRNIKQAVGNFVTENFKAGARIEISMRTRIFLTKFFEELDAGWAKLAARPVGVGTEILTGDLSNMVQSEIGRLTEPTIDDIVALRNKYTAKGVTQVHVVTLGQEAGFDTPNLDKAFRQKILDELNDLAASGATTRKDIKRIFDKGVNALEWSHQDAVRQTMRVFEDNLPKLSVSADEIYEALLPMEKVGLSDLAGAVDDLGLFRQRVTLETDRLVNTFAEELTTRWNQVDPKDIAAMEAVTDWIDNFWTVERLKPWVEFNAAQEEVLKRIASNADSLMKSIGSASRFPAELVDEYMDAVRRMQHLHELDADMWSVGAEAWRGAKSKRMKDLAYSAANKSVDDMWRAGKPGTQDSIDRALIAIKKWFADNGIESQAKGLSLADLGQNADQWVIGKKLEQSLKAVDAQYADMVSDMKKWYRSTLRNRVTPVTRIPVTARDKRVLMDYFDEMEKEVGALVSRAEEAAMTATNNTLFDYIETPNWMNLGSVVTPFVRWPAKNIPLWMSFLLKKPWIISTTAKLRQAQAITNRDLPTRLQYTIPITPVLPDNRVTQALGLANTQLRINPWSFISLFQQIPGGTPWKASQLAEMYDKAEYGEDLELRDATNMIAEFTGQMGFGPWPYWEYLLGMFGLLGDDWYPRDALGTWAPMLEWASVELFGAETPWNIDSFVRDKVPDLWNMLFGDTPLAWRDLNPDLMINWLQGREIEGLIMEMSPDEQARIAALPPEEQAIAMQAYQQLALRQALRKKMLSTFSGNMMGLYFQPVTQGEINGRLDRIQKRVRQEAIGPGPEYREFERLWREEHPYYGLTQRWRFSEYPWATTSAEAEAETWDTILSDYERRWWDFDAEWDRKFDEMLADLARRHPGEKTLWQLEKQDMYDQRDQMLRQLNEELQAELEGRFDAYIKAHPQDAKGIDLLLNGWEVPVYRQPHLTEEERISLNMTDIPIEEMVDIKAGRASAVAKQLQMESVWNNAMERRKGRLTEMAKVPGLNTPGGITLDLSSSENSRTDKEVWELRVGGILRKLADIAPDYEDYEAGKDWWTAYNAYLSALSDHALELPEVQEQIRNLALQQNMPIEEATEIVRGWYTQEELEEYWRQNDTVWEALEQAYQTAFVAAADEIYNNEIKPIKDTDYELYNAMKETFFMQNDAFDARQLIPYIMTMYAEKFETGEWNQKMLEDAFRGILMPSIQDRWLYRSKGRSALRSYVYHYYNKLTAAQKRTVQQKFGTAFTELFLAGKDDQVTPELLGHWVTQLSGMFGEAIEWKAIPGVMQESKISGSLAEYAEAGLPYVGPFDQAEFERAREINSRYWELRARGDPSYQVLENDPLRTKWFASVPQSLFWDFYYEKVPPGVPGKVIRDNPLVKLILDKGIRNAVATRTDYERALQLLESWVMLEYDLLVAYPPEEYEEARALLEQYYDIPAEDKEARKALKAAYPLLKKYLTEPSEEGDGASEAGGAAKKAGAAKAGGAKTATQVKADLKAAWTSLQRLVKGSWPAVYVLLSRAWRGTLGEAGMAYLRRLHAKLQVEMSFEEWLLALKDAAGLYGAGRTGAAPTPSKPRLPPQVEYAGGGNRAGVSGYRRFNR